MQEILIK